MSQVKIETDKINKHGYLSNAILELPQRIKLDLTDGVLTLKAGSEVIVPNGFEEDGTTPKFDYVTIQKDLTYGFLETQSGDYFLGCSGSAVGWVQVANTGSGTSTSSTYGYYYRTDLNKIYYQNNTSYTPDAFPLGIVTLSNGVPTLKQVFNGFGYIGSIIWVDKGVKGLISNGRNEDGTLNNYVVKTNKLILGSGIGTSSAYPYWHIWSNLSKDNLPAGYRNGAASTTYFQDEKPTLNNGVNYAIWYSPSENLVRFTNDAGSTWIKSDYCLIASYTCQNGTVTKFNPRTTFKALDYNDKIEISGWSMPSDKYIDLTFGASGSGYIAPANGWVFVRTKAATNSTFLQLNIPTNALQFYHNLYSVGARASGILPVQKGQIFSFGYGTGDTVEFFRFIYAQGEV